VQLGTCKLEIVLLAQNRSHTLRFSSLAVCTPPPAIPPASAGTLRASGAAGTEGGPAGAAGSGAGRVNLQKSMHIHWGNQKILEADGPVHVAELLQQSLQCASKLQQVEQANVLVYNHTTARVCKA